MVKVGKPNAYTPNYGDQTLLSRLYLVFLCSRSYLMYLSTMSLPKLIIGSLLLLFAPSLWSQGSRCLTHNKSQKIKAENPHLLDQLAQRDQQVKKIIRHQSSQKNGAVITLPMVFHVIYNTSAQNIDSLQIASQIDVINDDFRKLNANFNIIQGEFASTASDVQFEFKLADTDPDGNPTNGITRKVTTNQMIDIMIQISTVLQPGIQKDISISG